MANLPSLTPTTFGEALQFAEALAKSTMVPREYQRMPANILLAVQWGAELGLGPLQAINSIAIINGKPAVYGDAMLALVRGSPVCHDVVERIEGDGDNRTAICEAHRKGAVPVTGRFSVGDAKRAGLWDKVGPWKQYPLRMLQMRARGFALRDAFPDVLRGIISAEEASDIPRQIKDVTPQAMSAELDNFAAASDVAPDQTEADPLLVAARAQALNGRAAFRQWYREELDNEQRAGLRPHMDELRVTATRIDDMAPPPHPATAPDRSREASTQEAVVPRAASPPGLPESAPSNAGPPLPRPRSHPPSSEATKEEVERSQAMLEAVLGPEELARLDEEALPPAELDEPDEPKFEIIKPQRKGRGWDWHLYADEMIAAAKDVPIDQLGKWRGANSSMIDVCRRTDRDQWERLDHALADYEREGAA